MDCRVVTWNIHGCVGTDGRYDVARVLGVLAALDADIIGLQEVDWRRPRVHGSEAFDYLAAQLGMNAVEGPNLHDHRGRYGNGLLTRFPVAEYHEHTLAYAGREPRGAIDATLRPEGTAIRTLVTHLGLKFRERRRQVATLRELAASSDSNTPIVLLGDMNEWVSARLMRHAFTPAPFAQMVTGRTFPSRLPIFPLDCIFVGPEAAIVETGVVATPEARRASDHLPLVADITWPD